VQKHNAKLLTQRIYNVTLLHFTSIQFNYEIAQDKYAQLHYFHTTIQLSQSASHSAQQKERYAISACRINSDIAVNIRPQIC
jgi:hypothetical protein